MTVVVSPGFAVIEGGLCLEENSRTLAITASDPQFDRIDTIVVRWNENDAVRTADLHVIQGVPSRNPVRPELTREGSIYEIGIADVFVTHGVVTITNEKITDTRMEAERCGIVSSVSEWDTTTIYQQIQSELAHFKSTEEADFTTWFDYMKDQLTEDAAGRLQTEVDEINLLKADKTALAETNTNLENTNGNISIIEDTTTASRNYAVGEFVTVKTEGKLRKVTSAITIGGTISNSNTEITNAGAEISQINADLSELINRELAHQQGSTSVTWANLLSSLLPTLNSLDNETLQKCVFKTVQNGITRHFYLSSYEKGSYYIFNRNTNNTNSASIETIEIGPNAMYSRATIRSSGTSIADYTSDNTNGVRASLEIL
jgi:hypothetical protein